MAPEHLTGSFWLPKVSLCWWALHCPPRVFLHDVHLEDCFATWLCCAALSQCPGRRRCVVLLEGFYEWKATGAGKKQPYYAHLKEEGHQGVDGKQQREQEEVSGNGWDVMRMAGLYDTWTGARCGEGGHVACQGAEGLQDNSHGSHLLEWPDPHPLQYV